MSNRQQRRAAAKKGKRPGQNYADVLAEQKMIQKAVEKSAHDHAVAIESDIKAQRFMWMAVIALNDVFGFGGDRAKRFLKALEEVANETADMANEHGGLYARAKLMERAGKITGLEIQPIYEEEMRKARMENEAAGVFFPEDDPDEW